MVSFTCHNCQDVVKKPKVQSHANMCGSHSLTGVDCMHVFDLDTIKAHTSCVTEEDKYQGKWKQKLSSNNGGNGVAPRGIERPPRAPMNDLSSSDESDDDWVTSGGKGGKMAGVAHKTAAAAASSARRKNPRPGVSPSSDDDDDNDKDYNGQSHDTIRVVPPAKKARTTRSLSATHQAQPVATGAAVMAATHAVAHRSKGDEREGDDAAHLSKKDTPLLLPRSTASTDCIVPSFVLGTSEEVADIVRDILAEKGVAALRSKDLALSLVDRYAKRIAKNVRLAVGTAVELGALKLDAEGNVTVA